MNILIVKTSALGDIVQSFPILHYLKQIYPTSSIDWVVEKPFASLVQAHPFVCNVFTIDSKQWRNQWLSPSTWEEIDICKKKINSFVYDYVFDLQGNIKSACVTACARSEKKIGFDWKSVSEWPNLLFTHTKVHLAAEKNIYEDYLSFIQSVTTKEQKNAYTKTKLLLTEEEKNNLYQLKEQLQEQPLPTLLICPGSQWPNKQLDKETWIYLLQNLQTKTKVQFIFVWGNKEEQKFVQALSQELKENTRILEKCSLPLLQNYMLSVQGILAMDSLPLHLAATTPTPIYSIFGASSAKKYQPPGEKNKFFQGNCPYGYNFAKRCPILRTCKTGNCMKKIDKEALFCSLSNWWHSLC